MPAEVDDLGHKEVAFDLDPQAKVDAPEQGSRRDLRLAPHASAGDLEALCARALGRYGVHVLDSVDLSRLDGIAARAFVIARAPMERGDARAFAMAREILSYIETL